ncbi:hypothetical protein B0H16DRAFT_1644140 [Mycena metata]|uniref:Uncharacterized protein n=1 Tax=Mycena metata TaxID=1033252 RepID=A0AAD7DTP7_9AGAR|nr:hypothetical protein B0H16DRAFT_1644140 [Mycena metata]
MSPILSSDGAAGRSLCCHRHIPWWATVALAVAGSLVLPNKPLTSSLLLIQFFFCWCVLASLLPFLSPPILSFFFCLPYSSTRGCFYGRIRSRDPSLNSHFWFNLPVVLNGFEILILFSLFTFLFPSIFLFLALLLRKSIFL